MLQIELLGLFGISFQVYMFPPQHTVLSFLYILFMVRRFLYDAIKKISEKRVLCQSTTQIYFSQYHCMFHRQKSFPQSSTLMHQYRCFLSCQKLVSLTSEQVISVYSVLCAFNLPSCCFLNHLPHFQTLFLFHKAYIYSPAKNLPLLYLVQNVM